MNNAAQLDEQLVKTSGQTCFWLTLEAKPLRGVWIRLMVFLVLGFTALVVPVYILDPFAFFQKHSPVPEETRMRYAVGVNPVLWEVFAFLANPKPNVLLGDSETARLNAHEVEALTKAPYFNLACGGGSLRESIALFWYASEHVKLRRVFLGISFMQYSSYARNRVPEAEAIVKEPLLYFINFDVLEVGVYEAMDHFLRRRTDLGPGVTRSVFWSQQLATLPDLYRYRSSYPQDLLSELKKIAGYCSRNNVDFAFIVPPQHIDAQERVQELGAQQRYERFLTDLSSVAPTYDYDIASDITQNADNFSDPFHLTNEAASRVVQDLWLGELRFGRLLPLH